MSSNTASASSDAPTQMTEYKFADSLSRLGTETAFEVLAKAKALEAKGRDIVHLEIGEPDFDTPKHIIEAAVHALQNSQTHYTPANGIIELRTSILNHIIKTRGLKSDITNLLSTDNVVVTPGAKPILFFTILSLLQEGDEAIYMNPGFPIYESMINFVGAKSIPLPIRLNPDYDFNTHHSISDPSKKVPGFILNVEEFRSLITPKTKLIVINSPANPTGGVLSKEQIDIIAQEAIRHNIIVLSDEIYSGIIYDATASDNYYSILSVPGMVSRTVLLDGFSKTYAMTGWRLGYGLMPKEIAQKMTRLMTNSNSCTATFTQRAGIAALEGPMEEVNVMIQAFKDRRQVVVDGLNKIPGFRCAMPEGAFYVFPNIEQTGISSKDLAEAILYKGGVAVLDGACFGEYGRGFIRLSYANSIENIKKGVERIDKIVRELMEEKKNSSN